MKKIHWLAIVVGAFSLVACGGGGAAQQTETTPVAVADDPPPPAEVEEADPEDVRIEGDHLVIDRHINFASDSDEILADSNELIDHIALLLSHHSGEIGHLRIVGHTDAAGGHAHNQDLSERRAAAVARALQERGVTATLDHSGAGETAPLCEEDTDECHDRNRRVEFVIVAD